LSFESQHDVVVLYHKNCLDGIAAAWCAWNSLHYECDLVPVQYQDDFEEMFGPGFEKLMGKKVYCLDFAFDLQTTTYLMGICELLVLDHHDTAAKNLSSIAVNNWSKGWYHKEAGQSLVIVDQNHSGAMLAWLWFLGPGPETPAFPPEQIRFVEDRDLWKWQVDGSRPWTAAAFSHELTVENFDLLMMVPVTTTIVEGTAIQRHMEKTMNVLAKSARRFQLDEYDVPIVNCNALFASDLGAKLAQEEAFSVTYNDSQNARQFSLRTSRKDIKVNEIAERFGGGGHPGAAGFRIQFDDDRFFMSHLEVRSK